MGSHWGALSGRVTWSDLHFLSCYSLTLRTKRCLLNMQVSLLGFTACLRLLPSPAQISPLWCSLPHVQTKWFVPSACFHDTRHTLWKPLSTCLYFLVALNISDREGAPFMCFQHPAQWLPHSRLWPSLSGWMDGWMEGTEETKDHAYEVFETRFFFF